MAFLSNKSSTIIDGHSIANGRSVFSNVLAIPHIARRHSKELSAGEVRSGKVYLSGVCYRQ